MPNHVTNQITFGTDSEALKAFHKMLSDMQAKDGVYGSFDFNKLIPMPESLNIESGSRGENAFKQYQKFIEELTALSLDGVLQSVPDDTQQQRMQELKDRYEAIRLTDPDSWELGKQYYENLQTHGSKTWYEWCNKHWGTKWNAYDCVPLTKDSDTMQFYTAWSDVSELMRILSEKYPSARITYRWADEDIGMNVGERVFENGELIDWDLPVGGSREAYEMAATIMGRDLAEEGFSLSKDGSTYEWKDVDPVQPPPPKEKTAPTKKRKSRDAR